ncbi:MAG: SEC-C domain-containing protein [Acidimicrobiales bacterium]|nr:SEC-C domain-containing protein [Acidimicrobiales bacterium]
MADRPHDNATRPDAIRRRGAALLAEGPLAIEQLAAQLFEEGVLTDDDEEERLAEVLDALDEDCVFVELPDDRFGYLPALLDGITLSTVVDRDDALEGLLPLSPDCEPIAWWMLDHPAETVEGDAVEVLDTVEGPVAVVGDAFLPYDGGVVLVRYDGTVLRVEPLEDAEEIDVPPLDGPGEAALAAAVRAVFDRDAVEARLELPADEEPAPPWRHLLTGDLWWPLLAAPGTVPRGVVLPPMRRLLAATGLREVGSVVVPSDLEATLQQRWVLRNRLRGIYELVDGQIDAAESLIGAMRRFGEADPERVTLDGGGTAGAAALAGALGDAAVARVAFAHARDEAIAPRALLTLADAIIERVDERHAAGAHWLAGRALDHGGLPLEAEAHFEAALTGPGTAFAPAAVALAAVVADRGDASRAASLLRQGGVDIDSLEDAYDEQDEGEEGPPRDRPEDLFGYDGGIALLAEIMPWALARPRPTARRNEPCPCGSGRKYKHCHQGRPEPMPIEDRAAWLYAKARRYVADNRFRDELADVADRLVQASGLGHRLLDVVLDSELPADIVLHEGGRMVDFVQERRTLLPADEAELAVRWQAPLRSVFEVERTTGDALHLRDVPTGERLVIGSLERPDAMAGLLLGRPLPVGGGWRGFAGFVPLPAAWAQEAIDVLDGDDALEVAALVGRCLGALVQQGGAVA